MGRRHTNRPEGASQGPMDLEGERTLAAAEADDVEAQSADGDTRCPCGSEELLLEAYLRVVNGRPDPEPVEVEKLTCPRCGREFEAVLVEGGRVVRGELVGVVDLDE